VRKNRLSVSSQIGRIPDLDEEKPPNDYRHFCTRGNNEYIWQPLDVGIQRVMKLSMKWTSHRDIVNEVAAQMEAEVTEIKLDTSIGMLRDRAVGWAVNAIHDIDEKELIIKVISAYHDV
jgi:hypothetical protein